MKPVINFETDRMYARSVVETDRDIIMALRMDVSDLSTLYKRREDLQEIEWDDTLNSDNNISLAVFLKKDDSFVACSSFQGFRNDTIELGCDVVKEYRNQGLATELTMGMILTAESLFSAKSIIIKTSKENEASKRVAEKCGGVLIGTEPSWFAQGLERLMKSLGETDYPDEAWAKEKEEALEIIESGKDGVYIYKIDVAANRLLRR